ncbi:hypothetical protein ACWIGI_05540 [Nocardia sp. NPDC055321]
MNDVPRWKQLHFRVEGATGGKLSMLLRRVADALDTIDGVVVSDLTVHSILTDDAKFKPIVDVYYCLASDVDITGPVPPGSNIVFHATQANPFTKGTRGVSDLLKKFADETLTGCGEVQIETIVFNPPLDEEDAETSGPAH